MQWNLVRNINIINKKEIKTESSIQISTYKCKRFDKEHKGHNTCCHNIMWIKKLSIIIFKEVN